MSGESALRDLAMTYVNNTPASKAVPTSGSPCMDPREPLHILQEGFVFLGWASGASAMVTLPTPTAATNVPSDRWPLPP